MTSTRARAHILASVAALALGCSTAPVGAGTTAPPAASSAPPLGPVVQDFGEDILSTSLVLDLSTREAEATITVALPASGVASFEIGDLVVASVTVDGAAVPFVASPPRLDVDLRRLGVERPAITVRYAFRSHDHSDGWSPDEGVTFLWPQLCGNLFPCKSDPSDGLRFDLEVKGVPEGATAIYPRHIARDAPAYMPAIAVGAFTKIPLGATRAGTKVAVWHLPGEDAKARSGTKHLVDVFDFYERTYGAYAFGGEVGSVSAAWRSGGFGGMEHHPFWHVGARSLESEDTHAHEAAHGWFGDGVRIACWQDFVLSEGTASYVAARALGASGVDVWPDYGCQLATSCGKRNTVAYPAGCERIDMLLHPLWSSVPYMKGAFYLKAVADVIGASAVDDTLRAFYGAHVGRAAHMRDLIDALVAAAPDEKRGAVGALEAAWLTSLACPAEAETACKTR